MTDDPTTRPLPWKEPTLLAPLEGVGHAVLRELVAAQGGLGMVCMEYLRVGRAPVHGPALLRRIVRTAELPLSVQLLGADAGRLAEAAAVVAQSGAEVVDINLGCPVRRVVSKGAGAALLRDPAGLRGLLARVRGAVDGLLSAKIRTGFEDSSRVNAIGDAVASAGLDFVTVHARSRAQQYGGVADWRLIRHLKRRLSIPVVGNGDCWYALDALRMERETGCNAVMIGRGALRNPWIFAQAAALRDGRAPLAPGGADVVGYLERVAAAFADVFPDRPRLVTGRLKELVRYLGRAVPDSGAFIHEALRTPDTSALLQVAARRLGPRSAEELDLTAEGHLGLERSGGVGEDYSQPDARPR
jgi:nifR3 family TIM-barrel protein